MAIIHVAGTGYLYFPMPFVRSARVQLFLVPNSPEGAALRVAALPKVGSHIALCGRQGLRNLERATHPASTGRARRGLSSRRSGRRMGVTSSGWLSKSRQRADGPAKGSMRATFGSGWTGRRRLACTRRAQRTSSTPAHGYAALANFSQALFGAPLVRLPAFPRGHVWHIYRLLVADAVSFQVAPAASVHKSPR